MREWVSLTVLEVSKEAASPEIQNTGNKHNKIKYNWRSTASRDFEEFFKNIKQNQNSPN
jgi:hypothetical protein